MTDLHDPVERAKLIEAVGPEEYARRHADFLESCVVEICEGQKIRRIRSERWGWLYQVGDSGTAFVHLEAARTQARIEAGIRPA